MSPTLEESKTDVNLEQLVLPFEEPDDAKDHLTHIINPPSNMHIWVPGMDAQDVVQIARARGMTITALCGYEWVPKYNPEKFPVCDPCMTKAGELMRSNGE